MGPFNPLLSISTQLTEGMESHLGLTPRQSHARAVELLTLEDLLHISSAHESHFYPELGSEYFTHVRKHNFEWLIS